MLWIFACLPHLTCHVCAAPFLLVCVRQTLCRIDTTALSNMRTVPVVDMLPHASTGHMHACTHTASPIHLNLSPTPDGKPTGKRKVPMQADTPPSFCSHLSPSIPRECVYERHLSSSCMYPRTLHVRQLRQDQYIQISACPEMTASTASTGSTPAPTAAQLRSCTVSPLSTTCLDPSFRFTHVSGSNHPTCRRSGCSPRPLWDK